MLGYNLTVWGAEEDEELLRQIFSEFEEEYRGQADFVINYQPQSESHCMDALMADLENGADVFAFADDQLNVLVAAGALDPVEDATLVRDSNIPEAVVAFNPTVSPVLPNKEYIYHPEDQSIEK